MPKRDDSWLVSRLDELWSKYFPDVKQTNKVFIRFGRFSKLRLGSIRLEKVTGYSYITITGMFKDENIPQAVVDHTIAHELVHYAHGFSSNKVRMHKYPHAGGVVQQEMRQRGLENLHLAYKKWVIYYKKLLQPRYGYR